MSTSDIVFSALAASNADLLFGASATPPPPPVDGTMTIVFPAFGAQLLAQYRSDTERPTVGATRTPWEIGGNLQSDSRAAFDAALNTLSDTSSDWGAAVHRAVHIGSDYAVRLTRRAASARASCEKASHLASVQCRASHDLATHIQHSRRARFVGAMRAEWVRRASRFQDAARLARRSVAAASQDARPHAGQQLREQVTVGTALRRSCVSWWGAGRQPLPGAVPITPPGDTACYTPDPHLLFVAGTASDGALLYVCEAGTAPGAEPVYIPVQGVYIVSNTVSLIRVSDSAAVPVLALALSLDIESWSWGFTATVPASAEVLFDPDSGGAPVDLLATINGTQFRLLAESISRERSFGAAVLNVTGRGRNAALAAPYAPVLNFSNTEYRTAQQIANDVLMLNNVPIGWAVDWGLTDWGVPANAFAHQGTWIEALSVIAAAAGGYLQPHPTEQTIRFRHRYPVAPWNWGTVTPDFVLPVDAIVREGVRWMQKPGYNRVFVSGQEVGVLGQVSREGTAGDVVAPMVVDALITAADAARQRGRALLSDTGAHAIVSLRMPVLDATGIIEPGAFVEYIDGSVDRLGMVRSVQVEVGFPEVWQTLEVETHA